MSEQSIGISPKESKFSKFKQKTQGILRRSSPLTAESYLNSPREFIPISVQLSESTDPSHTAEGEFTNLFSDNKEYDLGNGDSIEQKIDTLLEHTTPKKDKVFLNQQLLFPTRSSEGEETMLSAQEIVESTLSPRSEIDETGFERTVFSYNGKTFAFRGLEELPLYQTLRSSSTRLLGEDPKHIPIDQYLMYKADVNETEIEGHETQHYLTTKTLQGVIDLVEDLGDIDHSLVSVKEEMQMNEYSDRTLALFDALIAANYVDEQNETFTKTSDPYAEALVSLALLGDMKAQDVLMKKLNVLKSLDERREETLVGGNKVNDDPLPVDGLVAVHATKYIPRREEDGYSIQTTFDATQGAIPRNSVHTTLNHKVMDIFGTGDWSTSSYEVVSKFPQMAEKNGLPTVINTVDTWWSLNPGERLHFPDAILVKPSEEKNDALYIYDEESKTVEYKVKDYTREDIKMILADHRDFMRDQFLSDFNSRAKFPFIEHLASDDTKAAWDIQKTTAVIEEIFERKDENSDDLWGFAQDFLEGTYGDVSVSEAVKTIVREKIAPEGMRPHVEKREEQIQEIGEAMTGWIMREPVAFVNRRAAELAIQQQGGTVEAPGMWSWGDSHDVSNRTYALAQRLHIGMGAHSASANSMILQEMSKFVGSADMSKNSWGDDFDWKEYTSEGLNQLVPQLDVASRRMLYGSGLLTSRAIKKKPPHFRRA